MEEQNKKREYIDLRVVINRLKQNKRLFYKVIPVVFVLGCAYSLCLPRYYRTTLKLVPEMASSSMGGGLADLASSFGFDLGDMQSNDAISPLLYPDLMEDNAFVAELYDIRVQSGLVKEDEEPIDTTYYAYIKYFQKCPFWEVWINAIGNLLSTDTSGGNGEFDPYSLSKREDNVMGKMRDNITIDIDKKTGVISLTTQAQDPLITKTLADSIQSRLQVYITRYRTNKARVDMDFYRARADEAKCEYDSVRHAYAKVSDRNYDAILTSVSTQRDDLEREMQLKYTTYTTLETQYQAALTKVQERTPAFTMLKGAEVPVRHAGPKRMMIVIGLCVFAAILLTIYSLKDELLYDRD